MKAVLFRATLFASIAFALVLFADFLSAATSGTSPDQEHRAGYWLAHALFHGAVLVLSAVGAGAAFLALGSSRPPWVAICIVAAAYGLVTVLAGPGALLLAGKFGVVIWLLIGSASFVIGAGLVKKPWRRPAL